MMSTRRHRGARDRANSGGTPRGERSAFLARLASTTAAAVTTARAGTSGSAAASSSDAHRSRRPPQHLPVPPRSRQAPPAPRCARHLFALGRLDAALLVIEGVELPDDTLQATTPYRFCPATLRRRDSLATLPGPLDPRRRLQGRLYSCSSRGPLAHSRGRLGRPSPHPDPRWLGRATPSIRPGDAPRGDGAKDLHSLPKRGGWCRRELRRGPTDSSRTTETPWGEVAHSGSSRVIADINRNSRQEKDLRSRRMGNGRRDADVFSLGTADNRTASSESGF
jgi:hypothetical protein